MDQLERDLRGALDDSRLHLPLRPDASHLIRAGVRRRRRNRVIASVAAGVVVAAGVGVGAAAMRPGGSGTQDVAPPANTTPTPTGKPALPKPTADEVPWAATAYDYHHPPAFPGTTPDAAVPWCSASQLSLSTTAQPASGVAVSASLTNVSSTTCALQGQPAVTVLSTTGRSIVSSTPEPFYVDQWVRLAPHQTAHDDFTWGGQYCGHSGTPARVQLALPHSGGLVSAALTHSPACNSTNVADNGALDVEGFVSTAGKSFTPLAGLSAGIDRLTTSVGPGGIVHYRLQLQSNDAAPVTMNPCLPYRERLVDQRSGSVLVERDYLLNCAAAPATIDGAQSNHATYFDMQITVPTNAPAGNYVLLWQSVLKPVHAWPDSDVQVGSAVPACVDGQITASDGGRGQAMGQYGNVVVLHNVSSSTCSLRGYPGVELVDSGNQPIGKPATRAGGYTFQDPGPTTIVLAAGTGVASFTFGGAAYDNVRQQTCPSSTAALVIPPGLRNQLRVPMSEPECPEGITTSAVVAGTHGSAP